MNDATELWVWVTQEKDGSVSQIGALIPELGVHMTLSARDKETALKLRPYAQSHAKATGQRAWLREYHYHRDHGGA